MFVPPSSRLHRQPARITTTETRRRIPQSPQLHPTGKPLRKLLHGRVTLPRSWSSFTSAALHIVIGVVTAVRGAVPRILKASETRFEQTLLLRSLAIQIIGCIKFSYISDIFFFFCKSRITSNTYRTI